MYNKNVINNETDYAELVGLCGICPIMRKIMRAHNGIIQQSLVTGVTAGLAESNGSLPPGL